MVVGIQRKTTAAELSDAPRGDEQDRCHLYCEEYASCSVQRLPVSGGGFAEQAPPFGLCLAVVIPTACNRVFKVFLSEQSEAESARRL